MLEDMLHQNRFSWSLRESGKEQKDWNIWNKSDAHEELYEWNSWKEEQMNGKMLCETNA